MREPAFLRPAALVLGLLLLVSAQLFWWVIFFHMNSERQAETEGRLDRAMEALADMGRVEEPAMLEKIGPHHRVKESVQSAREKERNRKHAMLISETIFVLLVMSYGSFRVIRSLRREARLARERSVFVNSVSHELKTPIASLMLDFETLLKRKLSEKQRREILEEDLREVRRLENQVNNLLESARIGERNSASVESSLTDVRAELESYLKTHRRTLERSHARVRITGPALLLKIDKERFMRIADNLIQNSVQYSPHKPELEIEMKREGTLGVVAFHDNGLGIPDSELANVFLPFYRLTSGSRRVKGTGLGLYLVQENVKAAGGSVKALHRPAGRGTTIEVRIPAGAP